MMSFDKIYTRNCGNYVLKYAVKYAPDDIVDSDEGEVMGKRSILLKAGQNSTLEGFEGKYSRLADCLANKGINVLVAAGDPYDGTDTIGDAVSLIRELEGFRNTTFVGISNGALIGSWYLSRYPDVFARAVFINMPIKAKHLNRTIDGLQRLSENNICSALVYGENDPSYLTLTEADFRLQFVSENDPSYSVLDELRTILDRVDLTIPNMAHNCSYEQLIKILLQV